MMRVKEPSGVLRDSYDEGAFEWGNVSDIATKLVPTYTKDTAKNLLARINTYNTMSAYEDKVAYTDYKRHVDTF